MLEKVEVRVRGALKNWIHGVQEENNQEIKRKDSTQNPAAGKPLQPRSVAQWMWLSDGR